MLTLEDGSPFKLHPFQRTMLTDLFNGVRETLVLISKKNGKSSLLAALALFHLCTVPDAECVIAAASRDQAEIMLRQAQGFIHRSEALSARLDVKQRQILHKKLRGRVRVMASDVDTADGVIPTLALVDELHRHKTADLYGVFRDGLGPRNGQMVTISTAGDSEDTPLGQLRAKAHKMRGLKRTGGYRYVQGNGFALHEWALDAGEDLSNFKLVKSVNPAPWQTQKELKARHDSPSMTTWQWARFACGVWLKGEHSAIQPSDWDQLAEDGAVIPEKSGVWVGMDLGWTKDTTALVPLWWESDERRVVGKPVVLKPPGDGTLLDDRLITGALADLAGRYDILGVVYDPEAGGQQMVQQLEREVDYPFVEHSQKNGPMSLADGRLMEAIRRKVLVHDSDATLRTHVLNAIEQPLGEAFRLVRPRRGARVPIDALTALSMAHNVAVAEEATANQPFVFDVIGG